MGIRPLFKKKRLNTVTILITILFLAIVILGILVVRKVTNLARTTGLNVSRAIIAPPGSIAFLDKDTGKEKQYLNILFIGLDEGRDDRGIIHHKGSRTDTIFVVNIDKKANRMGILSIPRDTWVHISDTYGENKINSAYGEAFWDEYKDTSQNYELSKAAGIRQLKKTVERFLGTGIDYHILVKIQAAKDLVDDLGGLTINVEKDMDYDDNWGKLHIHLKKGKQRLNGEQAVGYARFRHDEEGDWGRIRRQQQVMKALLQELKNPKHIQEMERIAYNIQKNIDTDLDINKMVDIGKVYMDFNPSNMVKGVITGSDEMIGGVMVIIPENSAKEQLVSRIIRDPSYIEIQQQWVAVLNGCGVQGLGGRTAEKLKEQGYNIVDVDNCKESLPRENTEIVDYFGNKAGAERLKEGLGIRSAKIIRGHSKKSDMLLDFTVILGKDVTSQTPQDTKEAKNTP